MAEEKSKWYTSYKEYKVITCVSCAYLYKNDEKYCQDCGDDGVNVNVDIYVTPIKSARFIELKFTIDKENGEVKFTPIEENIE